MKSIDYLLHSTTHFEAIGHIIEEGFKPSYSREQFADINILVPMISFSNVLLRDVGPAEVFHYGDYGIILTRSWGLGNELNPVCYTYKAGMLDDAVITILRNTSFLKFLRDYKSMLQKNTKDGGKPISEQVPISNLSEEIEVMLDYLSVKFDDQLFDSIVQNAEINYLASQKVIKLAKPYRVSDKNGQSFVAYNDREWRKLFSDLNYIYEGEPEYDFWNNEKKPHFHDRILSFELVDLKAVLVAQPSQILDVKAWLIKRFGKSAVENSIRDGSLVIGIKAEIINAGF